MEGERGGGELPILGLFNKMRRQRVLLPVERVAVILSLLPVEVVEAVTGDVSFVIEARLLRVESCFTVQFRAS